jgi:uncharacterized membrane protein
MRFYKNYKWLMPSALFTCVLVALRLIATQDDLFIFMPWNLFLAVLPLYFSYKAVRASGKYTTLIFLSLWLLFFPNAMYITTDVFHLKERPEVPLWYDMVLLVSAAINGMVYSLLSLYNVEKKLKQFIPSRYLKGALFGMLLLSGYGIYLGRYQRWNSWDIVTNPFSLGHDIARHVFHPIHYADAWMLSLLFAIWTFVLYDFLKKFRLKPVS